MKMAIAYMELVELPQSELELPRKDQSSRIEYMNVLKDWAKWDDLFSMTVLAKIKNYEYSENANELIIAPETITLLARPLKYGYPPAVIYYNELKAEIDPKNSDHYYTNIIFKSDYKQLFDI